ncbi:MAG: hypothetical protein OMM_04951 [Candidatus Magnetoglobus multicellularis str. Araruama]|uniref:Nucleotidyl transferase AbiEii/AbiGii toxin family protein n=1 Tax=Candidatus Magnetoglobus multicellularis str. Araruama TaxID=890399 RepID=A0A1V1NYX4_9BACT|nr:MAG: hypothetical protein OMM_04951 [Candidatus Magnetoglobus multicellularis str. Araruama]
MKNIHISILPEQQKSLFNIILKQDWISSFYLAGGTALGFHIGHRQSIDFDFFTQNKFDSSAIIQNLKSIGTFDLFDQSEDTINGSLDNVKILFFRYAYPLLVDLHSFKRLLIADMLDIALMKLEAIAGRGSKKDFIDLYFLLQYFSTKELFENYSLKYGIEIGNHYHLLKSLLYFKDAEHQPMPIMIKNIKWEEIKAEIVNQIKESQIITF